MIKKFKDYINEVRYINPNITDEQPILDNEIIRVYHGFNNFKDIQNILNNGLSGKEEARRIYSFESGNNPYGLFVTIDFNIAKKFAHSKIIIEFSTKISDLEAPVWVGGKSYFIQGEYTYSFKNLDEREQQRLINRQKEGGNPYDRISKSDRPELAATIFDNYEKQALYIGDLDPNMIKYVWYKQENSWTRFTRKDFMKKTNIKPEKDDFHFLPNEDFSLKKIIDIFYKDNPNDIKDYVRHIIFNINNSQELKNMFFPKQINQIKKLYKDGFFDEYLDKYLINKKNVY
jgi:hypothetical protein